MKKVLIIAASALAAALFTTSCVETTESESVTALREAKVAEMQAQADQARYKAIQDSIQAAIDRATSAAEIDALLLQQQQALLEAQQELERIQREIENSANQNVIDLFDSYKNEVSELNGLRTQLNNANARLTMYENNLVSVEEAVAIQTEHYQGLIAETEAELEGYNSYTGLDKSELKAEVTRLETLLTIAQGDYAAKFQIQSNAKNDLDDYVNNHYSITDIGDETHRIIVAIDSLVDVASNYYTINYNSETKIFTDDRLKYDNGVNKSYTVTVYLVNPTDILHARKAIKDAIGVPAATGENATPATLLYADVANAEAALKTAQDNLKAAQDSKDENAILNAEVNLINAENALAKAKEALAQALAEQVIFERLAAEVAVDGTTYAAYAAEIDGLETSEILTAYFDAYVECRDAQDYKNEIDGQLSAARNVNNLLTTDVQEMIKELEDKIAEYNEIIENLGRPDEYVYYDEDDDGVDDGYYIEYGSDSLERLIQQLNDEIADLTEQIAFQEEIVALAKAALEEALAGESTPAE